MGYGEGVSPLHYMKGLGREQCPFLKNFFDFRSQNVDFQCILSAIFAVQLPIVRAKTLLLGLGLTKHAAAVCMLATRALDNIVRHAAPQLPAVFQAFYDLLMNIRVKPDVCVTAMFVISYVWAEPSIKNQLPGRQRGHAPGPGWIRHWVYLLVGI